MGGREGEKEGGREGEREGGREVQGEEVVKRGRYIGSKEREGERWWVRGKVWW